MSWWRGPAGAIGTYERVFELQNGNWPKGLLDYELSEENRTKSFFNLGLPRITSDGFGLARWQEGGTKKAFWAGKTFLIPEWSGFGWVW